MALLTVLTFHSPGQTQMQGVFTSRASGVGHRKHTQPQHTGLSRLYPQLSCGCKRRVNT